MFKTGFLIKMVILVWRIVKYKVFYNVELEFNKILVEKYLVVYERWVTLYIYCFVVFRSLFLY